MEVITQNSQSPLGNCIINNNHNNNDKNRAMNVSFITVALRLVV